MIALILHEARLCQSMPSVIWTFFFFSFSSLKMDRFKSHTFESIEPASSLAVKMELPTLRCEHAGHCLAALHLDAHACSIPYSHYQLLPRVCFESGASTFAPSG